MSDESLTIAATRTFTAARSGSPSFTHAGLLPRQECYDQCSPAWDYYVGTSLRDRIAAGPA
jgi:hypothetical protein